MFALKALTLRDPYIPQEKSESKNNNHEDAGVNVSDNPDQDMVTRKKAPPLIPRTYIFSVLYGNCQT